MTGVVVDDWFWIPRPVSDPAIRLVCFPYAGGDAPAYRALAFAVPARVEVWALRSPGAARGSAVNAPTSIDALASDVVRILGNNPHPVVALLGESFGAAVALEVARQLPEAHRPLGLVVAGARPPHRWPSPAARPNPTSTNALMEYARRVMPGLSPELDAEHLEPILLALAEDLALVRTFEPGAKPRLDCPILALVGDGDPEIRDDEMAEWQRYSSAPSTSSRVVSAAHLVIQTGGATAARVLVDHLDRWFSAVHGDSVVMR